MASSSIVSFSLAVLVLICGVQSISASGEIVFTKCNTTDFQGVSPDNPLTLGCKVNTTVVTAAYQNYLAGLYYYTSSSDDKVILRELKLFDSVSFSLKDYNSGTYMCQITTRDVKTGQLTIYTDSFRVDNNLNSVELGDDCRANQDCMALNALCDDGECKCSGTNYIKFSKHHDTAACLTHVDLDNNPDTDPCVIDDQCQAIDSTFTCQGGRCLKTSHSLMSPAEIAGVTLGSLVVLLLLVIAGLLGTKK